MKKQPEIELKSFFEIEGNKVIKNGNFLGFDLYVFDNSSGFDGEITTYFVKNNKVYGKSIFSYSGGAECSASGDVEFKQLI